MALPDIHRVLEERGESICRPQFEGNHDVDQNDEGKGDEDKQTLEKNATEKRNFDTTSDEDEG